MNDNGESPRIRRLRKMRDMFHARAEDLRSKAGTGKGNTAELLANAQRFERLARKTERRMISMREKATMASIPRLKPQQGARPSWEQAATVATTAAAGGVYGASHIARLNRQRPRRPQAAPLASPMRTTRIALTLARLGMLGG